MGTDVFSYSGMSDNIKGQWAQYDQCTGGVWWWSHDAANERAREETGRLIYYCVYQRELQRMRLNVTDCLTRYVSDLTVLFFKIRMWCWIDHQAAPRSSEWSGEEYGHQPGILQRRRRRVLFILSYCMWSFTQNATHQIVDQNIDTTGRNLAQLVEQRPMCWGSAGSTPGLGPFAACHFPSLSLFPVPLFTCTVNKVIKGQKNT